MALTCRDAFVTILVVQGKDVMGLGVKGSRVGQLLKEQVKFQIERPTASRDDCLKYLHSQVTALKK